MENKTSAAQPEPSRTESVPDQRAGFPAMPRHARTSSGGLMSDRGSSGLSRLPAPVTEVVGSGKAMESRTAPRQARVRVVVSEGPRKRKRKRQCRLPTQTLEGDIRWCADQLRRKYPDWSGAMKKRALSLLHQELPPCPRSVGRPRRQDVTQAVQLEATGVSRKEIYRRLGKSTRDEQHALREAMRQRRARNRKRDKPPTVTPIN